MLRLFQLVSCYWGCVYRLPEEWSIWHNGSLYTETWQQGTACEAIGETTFLLTPFITYAMSSWMQAGPQGECEGRRLWSRRGYVCQRLSKGGEQEQDSEGSLQMDASREPWRWTLFTTQWCGMLYWIQDSLKWGHNRTILSRHKVLTCSLPPPPCPVGIWCNLLGDIHSWQDPLPSPGPTYSTEDGERGPSSGVSWQPGMCPWNVSMHIIMYKYYNPWNWNSWVPTCYTLYIQYNLTNSMLDSLQLVWFSLCQVYVNEEVLETLSLRETTF